MSPESPYKELIALRQRVAQLETEIESKSWINRQKALMSVITKVRQSMNLETIFQTGTQEVRQLLIADRVAVFRFDPDSYSEGKFVSEDVLPPFGSALAAKVRDRCFGEQYAVHYQQGRIQAVADIHHAGLSDCHVAILSQFQIRANLVVPLLQGEHLWGLLCIHQCNQPRDWQQEEIEFAQTVAVHLAVAIGQAELLAQTRQQLKELACINAALKAETNHRQQVEDQLTHAKAELESKVEERTAKLQEVIVHLQREIGDRTIAEQQLRESQEQWQNSQQLLQSIIDNTNACIFVKEYLQTDGNFLLINKQFETLFHISQDEIVGKNDYDLFPKAAADTFQQVDQEVFKSGKIIQLEEVVPQADGMHTYLSIKFPLLNSDGNPYAVCGIATDITARKQAELALQQIKAELEIRVEERTAELQRTVAQLQQEIGDRQQAEVALRQSEQQLKQKAQELEQTLAELTRAQSQLIQSEKMSGLGQLVAGVAHEINNPVNFIFGNLIHANDYTQDLLSLVDLYQKHYPNPDPEIVDEIEAIDLDFLAEDLPKLFCSMKIGSERIQKIVLSLRNFSRMDEADKKEVNIHDGLDSTLMILEHRLKAKPDRAAIEIIKDYGTLPLVECYAGELNQVFMNILANAIDALESSIILRDNQLPTIRICTEITDSNWVIIRIADNGIGMTEIVQNRLFDPFFTTKPVGQGTGMGLSISYQIVTERHGGFLECSSSLGKGSEFTIKIPHQQL